MTFTKHQHLDHLLGKQRNVPLRPHFSHVNIFSGKPPLFFASVPWQNEQNSSRTTAPGFAAPWVTVSAAVELVASAGAGDLPSFLRFGTLAGVADERARGCGFGLGRAVAEVADGTGVAAFGAGAGAGAGFGIAVGAAGGGGGGGADDFAVAALGAPRLGLSLSGSFSDSASSAPFTGNVSGGGDSRYGLLSTTGSSSKYGLL